MGSFTAQPGAGPSGGGGLIGQLLRDPKIAAALKSQSKSSVADQSDSGAFQGNNGAYQGDPNIGMKKGGKVSSASRRADGIAQRGKTRGKIV